MENKNILDELDFKPITKEQIDEIKIEAYNVYEY
jgi:hypothetical protein